MEHNMILPQAGVIPVVVLDDAKDAVPTAKALLTGGVDVMEITFRTAAAADSIKAVSENCPEMFVGAGRPTSAKKRWNAVRNSSFRRALTRRWSAGAWSGTFPLPPAA